MDIKKQGINAAKWAVFDRAGSQVILLISTLILARLLSPKDFGLVSMLYIFIAISTLFVDSGMGGGLVRKQNLTTADCNTFFYFNISVAVSVYIVLFLIAPYIAIFYKEPIVTDILRVLGLNVIINAFGLVQKTLLVRDLKIRLVTRSSLIGSFIATIIGIIAAFAGFGVWSLLIINMGGSLISVLLLWKFSGWTPTKIVSKQSFQEMYAFGLGLFLSSFIDVIFKNIYQPLIGKVFSPVHAGFYYQAKRLNEVPILSISSVVDSITYPILAKCQDNKHQLEDMYKKIVKLLIFVSIPIVICLYFLANEIVLVLLGKKWLFAADLLKILSFSGIFLILETINRSLLKLEGRTNLIFKLEVVKKIIIAITILITYQLGIKALVIGMVINAIISFALNQYFTSIKMSDYPSLLLIVFNGILMGLIVYSVTHYIFNPYVSLVVGGTTGLLVYIALGFLTKLQEQQQVLRLITTKLK